MFFERIYEKGLAQASYVVGCQATGEALVLDPKRDVDTYLALAARERLSITHVAETHIHADFLSGSRELAELTGAKLLLSDEGGPDWLYAFPHEGLRDGDRFHLGRIRFDVLHTPGHTPEHVSFLLTDTAAGDAPMMALTGDFVFVGDVGRPDLLEAVAGATGTRALAAREMWTSLRRFLDLPEHVQVWPGHGAGSACGKALGAVPNSTVGYEKRTSWAFRHRAEDGFVDALLDGQPEPPAYFATMKRRNREPRPLLTRVPEPPELGPDDVERHLASGAAVIDARGAAAFARGHIPGSLHIAGGAAFSTWAGWLVPYDTPIVLVAKPEGVDGLVRALMRIGLDHVAGYVPDVEGWQNGGRALEEVRQIDAEALAARLASGSTTLVDVRAASEFAAGHIPGARHIHLGHLEARAGELSREGEIVLHCQGGGRSSTACSILARSGFRNVVNLTGGFGAWAREGLDVSSGAQAP